MDSCALRGRAGVEGVVFGLFLAVGDSAQGGFDGLGGFLAGIALEAGGLDGDFADRGDGDEE